MLAALGCRLEWGAWGAGLAGPARLSGGRIAVPGDFSSAAFFLVGGLLAARDEALVLRGVGVNPTRTGLVEVLRAMGGRIDVSAEREEGGEPVADLSVRACDLRGVDVPPELVPLAIDEFPALFVAAAFARGCTRVRGAAELRVKESDRLTVMARGLAALGVRVRELEDGIEIEGGGASSGSVRSHGDHRVAMAFAMAGSRVPVEVHDVANVATSFPGFEAAAATIGLTLDRLDGGT
jgi:3-phosphoshikimate 1-carboxyvinyltransferase